MEKRRAMASSEKSGGGAPSGVADSGAASCFSPSASGVRMAAAFCRRGASAGPAMASGAGAGASSAGSGSGSSGAARPSMASMIWRRTSSTPSAAARSLKSVGFSLRSRNTGAATMPSTAEFQTPNPPPSHGRRGRSRARNRVSGGSVRKRQRGVAFGSRP